MSGEAPVQKGGSNMKKTTFLALLILALGGARLEASSALAGNDARADFGIDRLIAQFTAVYENMIGGTFTCEGVRVSNKSLTRDTEECTLTDLSTWPPGTYIGHPNYVVNGMGYIWNSDYDGAQAHHVRIIITDNGDGTGHASLEAFY